MSTANAIVVALLALLTVLGLVGGGIYNRLVRARVRTREAWSGIDVQLKRRASLIPNLVETVRGYASHERDTLDAVARARGSLDQAASPGDAATANDELSRTLGRLFAVVEAYPELRASENFSRLHQDLADVEEKIAYARQFYNRNVADFNARIQTLPDVLVARAMGLERFEFFELGDETATEVSVDFG